MSAQASNTVPFNLHTSTKYRLHLAKGPEESRFASAVRPEHANELASMQLQIQVLKDYGALGPT